MADTRDANEMDRDHQQLYTVEAGLYDAHRFRAKRGRLYHVMELQMILELLAPLAGKHVLDVATGTGRISLGMQQAGAQVVGADLTYQMLQTARGKQATQGLDGPKCVNANGRDLPFGDHAFDIVTCVRFLHLLPVDQWFAFLAEMRRVVRPDGILLLELFNPLYGGPLSMGRQVWHQLRGRPGERYVWPWQLERTLDGFCIRSVSAFWLPGMGILGNEQSPRFYDFGRFCTRSSALRWIAGPFLIVASPA